MENGKRVFVTEGCENCHGAAGQGGSPTGIAGPRISPPKQSFSAFTAQVREPRGQMPAYSVAKVSDADLQDTYTFLKFNQPQGISPPSARALVAGNGQSGKLLYTKYGCYDCHGRYGEGSTATGPRLNPIPVSLKGLVSYLRHPAGDMPPYTDKVVSDSELADIFAFLQSLPAPPKAENIPLLK